MASNATSTGIPNDTAKKRKGAPSANEIFTEPVPAANETVFNGERTQNAPKRVYVSQSKQVFSDCMHANYVKGINVEELTPHAIAVILTLLSFFTRLYRIGKSNIVTWDEAQ